MKCDVLVLGAGMVGICVALHLQKRGRATVLVDRRGAAEETSFGNAGLVQREGVYPYGFPHDFGALLRYSFNRTIDAHYHPSAIPRLAPFLWKYWHHSRPARHRAIAQLYSKLIEHCITEHQALAAEAGAMDLFRRSGWMKVFRTERERDLRFAEAERWRNEFGINFAALDRKQVQEKEPHLAPVLEGALHWTDPLAAVDPQAVALAYLERFEKMGGRLVQGNAATLEADGSGWRVRTANGALAARDAVVALGPWADAGIRRLGYDRPLPAQRRGIRLTTGAEFALRDGMKTPVQLNRAEPIARELFPLGDRLDADPWMGSRPCTPDMMPVIGPAPRHRGLWFAFGHAHHGFTLGPATGRLLAELIVGEQPFVDPAPFAPGRLGRSA